MPDILQQRLDFIGLGEGVEVRLAPIAGRAADHLERALERFHAQAAATPSAARFLFGRERVEGSGAGPAAHWRALVAGQVDAAFADAAQRTGQRHARIGVDPRWHIGSYAIILDAVLKGVMRDVLAEAVQPRRGPLALLGAPDPAVVLKAAEVTADGLAALVSAALLDLDLTMAGYAERLRLDAQDEATSQRARLHRMAEQAGQMLERAAEGQLHPALGEAPSPELAPLYAGAEKLADRMIGLVSDLEVAGRSVETLARQVLDGGRELVAGRVAWVDKAAALTAILAPQGEHPSLPLKRSTASGQARTLQRRCRKVGGAVEAVRGALADAHGSDQQAMLSEQADALGLAAGLLASRLAGPPSQPGPDERLEGDMRTLAAGLAQLAAQLRVNHAATLRAATDAQHGLADVAGLVQRLCDDLEAHRAVLVAEGAGDAQRHAALDEGAMLAQQLETALAADRQRTMEAKLAIETALEGAGALLNLAKVLDGQSGPGGASETFPAPDNAALAAHWHVL
ncbi:protoglobin domain-containing protein [Devosia salina]|uniref:Globin-sensor domain-containing protein n=1 Tax=Devosia salina TaxID=2860336 RepID=A0ABX8WEL5_9HYPH|nr:protoglobin domain-containing protein [Devosia salina]QYO76504.1 hypothetical protein K1X15_18215 [Devosia salina]